MKRVLLFTAVALCVAGFVLRLVQGETAVSPRPPAPAASVPPATTLPPRTTEAIPDDGTLPSLEALRAAVPDFVDAMFTRRYDEDPAARLDRLSKYGTQAFLDTQRIASASAGDQSLQTRKLVISVESDPDSIVIEPASGGNVAVVSIDIVIISTGQYEDGPETWQNDLTYRTEWHATPAGWRVADEITWSGSP